MELLFKRAQTSGKVGRVAFKLWAKVEPDEDEQALISRYRFDEKILIEADQPELLGTSRLVAVGAGIVTYLLAGTIVPGSVALLFALVGGAGVGYWYYHNNRETIFVRDLLHGRYFSCGSVIDLAKREAWLNTLASFLRQVMESAKYWDGTERHTIEPLPKEEARQVIIQGI